MTIRDALIDMYRRYPFLRAAVWAMLTCWVIAGVLATLDALNMITLPDRR